jgi:hypothetical protein
MPPAENVATIQATRGNLLGSGTGMKKTPYLFTEVLIA